MSHETGAQRYRRLKRDPLRHQVLAPSYTVPPVRCGCGHARLMHNIEPFQIGKPACFSHGCPCTEYREVEEA